ncbi:uncharacterized protein AAG666_014199 [Megaptera novaeangliae]
MEAGARKERVDASSQLAGETFLVMKTIPREPMELAALQNVSVWRRTPWDAAPKTAVAPADLVTKATDDRKNALREPLIRNVRAAAKTRIRVSVVGEVCTCSGGWIRTVCGKGTNGKDCKQVCQCSAENEECHPITGRCTCLPGYHGNRYHLRCPRGTYGPYCQRKRKCLNGGSCDTMIGTCDCPPGFIGADCSQTCPEDHYGQDYVQRRSCGSGQGDPVTGGCQCPPGQTGARCQHGNNAFRVTLFVQPLIKLNFEGSECEYPPSFAANLTIMKLGSMAQAKAPCTGGG